MKTYPSIPVSNGQSFEGLGLVDVFDKLDGNNLRFEFSSKRGWYKFGSRTQMIDATHEQFGDGVQFFLDNVADDLLACVRKPQKMTVFAEWWGPQSLAGMHQDGDDMRLTVFDATLNNKGWMSPKEFRKTFEGNIDTPDHLGQHNWTRGFIERVKAGELEGITFEGVVGKTLTGPRLRMGKAKTQRWIDAVNVLFGKDSPSMVDF